MHRASAKRTAPVSGRCLTVVRSRPSIRIQLFGLALAVVTPVAGAVAYFVFDAARERRNQAEGEIHNLAKTTAKDIAATLAESERLLSVLARRPLIRALDPGHCDPVVAEFAELHPVYSNLAIRDRHGAGVCSILPRIAPARTAAKFPWFQEGIRSRGFIAGDASYGEASGRWFSALTYPLLDDRGEVIGVLALGIDLLELQRRILPSVPKDIVVSVIDRQGRILMRSADPERWVGKTVNSPANVALARGSAEGILRVAGVDGIVRVFAYQTVAPNSWLVSVGIPEDTLFAPFRQRLAVAIAVVLVALLLALVLARELSKTIARPIRDLETTTERVVEGDLSARASLVGPAELTNVARELNRMLDVRERADTEMHDLNRTLTVLSSCNESLVRATAEQELLDEMCRILVEQGGYALAWIGFAEDDDAKRVRPVARAGATGYLDALQISWGDDESGRGPTGTAIRTGQAVFVRDTSTDVGFRKWHSSAERFGFRSTIALPLGRDLPAFGVMNMYSVEPNRFNEKELKLLAELAEDVTYGIQSLRTETRRREAEQAQRESDERFRQIAENIREVFWMTDPWKNRVLYVSPAYQDIWGRSVGELYRDPRQWTGAIHAEDRERVLKATSEQQASGEYDEEYRILRPDGTLRWIRDRAFPIRDAQGEVYRLVGTAEDITERKLAELHVKNLNRIYAVLSGINALIVRVGDPEELFREACRVAVGAGQFRMAWIGLLDRGAMRVRPIAWDGDMRGFFDSAPLAVTENRPGGHGLAGRAVREKKAVVSNDIESDPQRMMKKELRERGIRSLAVLPLLVGGDAVGVLALYAAEVGFFDDEEMKLLTELASDISFALDHLEKAQKLDYIAYYDVLTGLANRSLFYDRLTQTLRAAGQENAGLALVLLDIERFRAVNDSLGRQAGDELLRLVAQRLIHCIGDPALLGRLGGDHFAVILPGKRPPDEIAGLLREQSRRCFGEPFRLPNGTDLRIFVKAGVALGPQDGGDAETLHRNAEAALTHAKDSGERFLFYAGRMTERVSEKLALENQLRLALEREEFVLHYQPVVDLRTRRVEGVEALIRWQNPERGLVPPMHFIPLMEETGMILEAGAWAMRRAALDHRDWTAKGFGAPRISVNVSSIQLRKRDFVQTVQAALAEGVKPIGIDLEITESLIMENIEENIEKLAAVRDMGIAIAVDDFGTGYSSLRYLAKLPAQTLKIDRSFIVTMLDDPNAMTLVSTIISLAHSLGLKVVAEGVDSEEQAEILLKLKCDRMQGFHIGRPMPQDQLLALLASGKLSARPRS